MKYFKIIFLFLNGCLFSQELSQDEYVIYAQVLDNFGYSSNNFYLGLTSDENASLMVSRDQVESKIASLNSEKIFNLSRLDSYILKYRKDRPLSDRNYVDRLKDYKNKITCSIIYFKSETEAYVYGLAEFKTLKTREFLLKATKESDAYWCFENYTYYY